MESIEEQKKSSRLLLVAIDDTEDSINALQWALDSLFTSQDRIILIHARRAAISTLSTVGSPGFMLPVEELKMLENDIKKSTEKILAKTMEICKAKMVTPETEVQTGDAKKVICDAAKKYNPDMLVLASHGHGALKRVVLGSVSDYCVQHAQCPVVVVKPKKNKSH